MPLFRNAHETAHIQTQSGLQLFLELDFTRFLVGSLDVRQIAGNDVLALQLEIHHSPYKTYLTAEQTFHIASHIPVPGTFAHWEAKFVPIKTFSIYSNKYSKKQVALRQKTGASLY